MSARVRILVRPPVVARSCHRWAAEPLPSVALAFPAAALPNQEKKGKKNNFPLLRNLNLLSIILIYYAFILREAAEGSFSFFFFFFNHRFLIS